LKSIEDISGAAISATSEGSEVRPAGGEKHAHAGRAAWGVLGSAAGGRVLVCGSEPGRPEQSFGGKEKILH
jgi:hypothetical protein